MAGVGDDDVRAAALALTGDLMQVPPMVSAVKIGGKRLHELARAGIEVDRPPRPVTVHRFTVEPVPGEPGVYRVEVDCSSGTYIRSLAADLGRALGGGAHLRRLRRTAVGPFLESLARPLEQIELLPPRDALRGHPSVTVAGPLLNDVRHGRVIPVEVLGGSGPVWALLDGEGALLAVYESHKPGTAKPAVVLAPAG
jgi:tRNA pseudouridine55 synthase